MNAVSRFRDEVARDVAWARYYLNRGLRPVRRDLRPMPNQIRRAVYETRKALSQTVRC